MCLSIRIFRCYSGSQPSNTTETRWIDDNTEISDALEAAEESVISELITILENELENGLANEAIREGVRKAGNAAGVPLARANHFFFGVLDIIQQHFKTLSSIKFNNKVVQLAVKVVENCPSSYLRCKAFEILHAMALKSDIGQMPVRMVQQLLEKNNWTKKVIQKFKTQWFAMQKCAVDMEQCLFDLRDDPLPLTLPSVPVQYLPYSYMINIIADRRSINSGLDKSSRQSYFDTFG